jgi:hypothetical protein
MTTAVRSMGAYREHYLPATDARPPASQMGSSTSAMLTAASAADERTREIRNKFIKYLAALAVSFEHKSPNG